MPRPDYYRITKATWETLIAFENNPDKPDMRMALIEDTFVPSDDCYLQDDGTVKISSGAYQLAENYGLILPTI